MRAIHFLRDAAAAILALLGGVLGLVIYLAVFALIGIGPRRALRQLGHPERG